MTRYRRFRKRLEAKNPLNSNVPVVSKESVHFSIVSSAAWAPGVETNDAWRAWAKDEYMITRGKDPSVKNMTPMLRRRAGFAAKMALEVAYQCLGNRTGVPLVFSSRHGEAARSADLLLELAGGAPLSPTSFGLSVHNAPAGLFSIARVDHANSTAVAAGRSSVESAVIEACGLLAEGEPERAAGRVRLPVARRYTPIFRIASNSPMLGLGSCNRRRDDFYSLHWSAGEDTAISQTTSVYRPGWKSCAFICAVTLFCSAGATSAAGNGRIMLR